MQIRVALKAAAERIPYWLGRHLASVPYELRLGREYSVALRNIAKFNEMSGDERQEFIFRALRDVVHYASSNFISYQKLYGESRVWIKTFDEFRQLPILEKSDARRLFLECRGAFKVNTGGTSGEPLGLYLDKGAWAREWAHMHHAWSAVGYHHSDLMITLLGKNLEGRFMKYNAVHNEFKINTYLDAGQHFNEIEVLLDRYPVRFIQGYPSAIYNFFRELEGNASDKFRVRIRSQIRSCLLSSEYPIPYMIKYLEEEWGLTCFSWYGHSEMCVLAPQCGGENYAPYPTYGFAEEISGSLLGTSYNNLSMPLIRYRTGDRINVTKIQGNIINQFLIEEGREGDFIVDLNGKRIPVTGLIFGRHHKIFELADYVQVYQPAPGTVYLYITMAERSGEVGNSLFDFSNLDIEFKLIRIPRPIRSRTQKLKLVLSPADAESAEGI